MHLEGNKLVVVSSSTAYHIDSRTGAIRASENWISADVVSTGFQWYDSLTDTLILSSTGGIKKLFLGRGGGVGDQLANIVSDLCDRSGLALSDVDVTELTDTVEGYLIGRQADLGSGGDRAPGGGVLF